MAKIPNSIPLGGMIAPTDDTDVYPTNDANYCRGGIHHKADIVGRDSITPQRRTEGMLCTVVTDDNGQPNMYRLVGGIENANWEEVTTKGGKVGAMSFKGTIAPGTEYAAGDVVYDNKGGTWMFVNSTATNAWVAPDTTRYENNAYWSLISGPAEWSTVRGDITQQTDLNNALTALGTRIDEVKNAALYIGMANHGSAAIKANTTLLTARAKALGFTKNDTGDDVPYENVILRDNEFHDWQFTGADWEDQGLGVVGVAGTGILGLVRGSADAGKAMVNAEGDICIFEVSETPDAYDALKTGSKLQPGVLYCVKPEGDNLGGIYLALTANTDVALGNNSTQKLTSELTNNSDTIGASARAAKDLNDRITNLETSVSPGGTIRQVIDTAIDAKLDKTAVTSDLGTDSEAVVATAKAAKTLSDNIEAVATRVQTLEQNAQQANPGGTFGDDTPTTVAWDKIPAGTDLSEKTWQEIVKMQVFPYMDPSFTGMSISTFGATTKEVGTEIGANGSLTFTVAQAKNIEPASMTLKDHLGATVLSKFDSSPQTITHDAWTSTSAGTTNWTLSAKSTAKKDFTRTLGITWQFKLYYGERNEATIDEAGIKGLRSGNLSGNKNGDYAFQAGGYKYIAVPKNLGKPGTFKDKSNNLPVPMEDLGEIQVTNANGVQQGYYVFRTSNVLGGTITIMVS